MSSVQANSSYSLTNVKGGTCLDLSGGDNVSIIGYGYHQGPNQTWTFQDAGNQTYNIKSAGGGQYLSVAGDPSDGQRVVASGSAYPWRVEDQQGVDGGVRLLPANNTNFCVDLADHGSSTPGTSVQLWSRWDGQNQIWKVQKVQ
ncbi:carbohydrate-binding module family 13 protein [Boletus reticuloceps]|uniref:Carbohydrate-binding module family 13 protein n=1 Tax=Boletus reticuloceps TaxID=495285 RepID=A0A8I2YIF0_9AGAM|nr:carbohydrate-binding module family 13 protein [Boletus reticuloceps]